MGSIRPKTRSRILLLHGGVHCYYSAKAYAPLASRLAALTGLPVLAPDYRLAPSCPFPAAVDDRAGKESEMPNFKGSYLGRFSLVSADFWTSDHPLERSRSVDAFSGTRARGTLMLKRR